MVQKSILTSIRRSDPCVLFVAFTAGACAATIVISCTFSLPVVAEDVAHAPQLALRPGQQHDVIPKPESLSASGDVSTAHAPQDLASETHGSGNTKVHDGWLRAQFNWADADHDGILDDDELMHASMKAHLTATYASQFLSMKEGHEMSFDNFVSNVWQLEHTGDKMSMNEFQHVQQGVFGESVTRATLLLGLMMVQSGSAMVLGRYEAFVKEHMIVVLFLTMLVGAGGNVGNQSVIQVIEKLISGKLKVDAASCVEAMFNQLTVGILLAVILGVGGFTRAFVTQYYFRAPGADGSRALLGCVAVTVALMVIVVTSAVLGTMLPLLLAFSNIDVAHAGPSIQVIMDIGGVIITCAIARSILEGR